MTTKQHGTAVAASDAGRAQDDADVPVTAKLLTLALTLRAAATLFLRESSLAEHFALPQPHAYVTRCEEAFYKTYGEQARLAGLKLNTVTFEAIVFGHLPDEVHHVPYEDLPKQWVFNPWRGWRKCTAQGSDAPSATQAQPAGGSIENWTSRPVCCPHCRSTTIRDIDVQWKATSLASMDSGNTCVIAEYQCLGECEGRSFFA